MAQVKQHSAKQKKISSLSLASKSSPVQESDSSSDESLVPSLKLIHCKLIHGYVSWKNVLVYKVIKSKS